MTLLRNSGHNFVAQLIQGASGLAATAVTARVLGPSAAGRYALLLYLMLALSSLATAGLPTTITRVVARQRVLGDAGGAERARRWCTRLGVIVAVGTALLLVLVALSGLRPSGVERRDLLLAAVTIPITAYVVLATAGAQGRHQFGRLMRQSLILAPVSLGLTVLALAAGGGVTSLLAANLSTAGLTAILLGRAAPAREPGSPPAAVRRELRAFAVPVSVIAIMDVVVWQRSEVLFLSGFSTARQVAFYALAFTVVSRVMSLLPGSLSGVLLARFAGDHAIGDLDAGFTAAVRYLTMITAPIMGVGVIFARPLVTILFGSAYRPMAPVLAILVVSAGLAAIITAGSSALYSAGEQRFLVRLAVVIAAVNIAADLVLIPTYGAVGAACCNGAAQLLGIGCGSTYLVRRIHLVVPWAILGRLLACGFGAAALGRGIVELGGVGSSASVIVGIATAAASYVPAAVLVGGLNRPEREYIGMVLRRQPAALAVDAGGPQRPAPSGGSA